MATLTAKNLAKAYKGRRVVEDVSLTVNSGEIVGLLGPNGAGKTTTFYMVVGIVPRDAGNIIIDDEDISLLPLHARARRGIGYLPQEASIFRRLSVYDNLMAVLQIRDDLTSEQREDRAKELMEEFHIEHLRDSLGQALSGGERRRVEIARALAANPKFILLDEPFAGVDPISVIDIKRIIEHLRDSGLGVLIQYAHFPLGLAVIIHALLEQFDRVRAERTGQRLHCVCRQQDLLSVVDERHGLHRLFHRLRRYFAALWRLILRFFLLLFGALVFRAVLHGLLCALGGGLLVFQIVIAFKRRKEIVAIKTVHVRAGVGCIAVLGKIL